MAHEWKIGDRARRKRVGNQAPEKCHLGMEFVVKQFSGDMLCDGEWLHDADHCEYIAPPRPEFRGKYWMIHSSSGKPLKSMHPSEACVRQAASALSKANPGTRYTILEAIDSYMVEKTEVG